MEHVVNDKCSGRPKEISKEKEKELLDILYNSGRSKSSKMLAFEINTPISKSLACNILNKHGYNSVKPTTKPGLNKKNKAKRL